MRKLRHFSLILFGSGFLTLLVWTTVVAGTVEVAPSNLSGWAPANVRNNGTVTITDTVPRSGDGSLEFQTVSGGDKADFELIWGDRPTSTLGTLDQLSFEYYRDGTSSSPAHLAPVFRLWVHNDGSTPSDPSDDDYALLIWEQVYQVGSGPVATDSWQTRDILNGRFWMYVAYPPANVGVIQDFDATLSDWLSGNIQPQSGDPTPPVLSTATTVVGLNVGVGSGWSGTFTGNVDNLTAGFGGQSTTYNFEPDAPTAVLFTQSEVHAPGYPIGLPLLWIWGLVAATAVLLCLRHKPYQK